MQPGDIVTHINDTPIENANSVYQLLENSSVNVLNMTVVRGHKRIHLSITPEEIYN